MAKIKFPLEMANGVQARTLNDLKENFDIEKVTGYFLDGKLQTWLEDRYYEDEAEAISFLETVEYPIICKAVDQTSGVGILRANDYEEAKSAIHNSFEKSRMKKIVIEPFIIVVKIHLIFL